MGRCDAIASQVFAAAALRSRQALQIELNVRGDPSIRVWTAHNSLVGRGQGIMQSSLYASRNSRTMYSRSTQGHINSLPYVCSCIRNRDEAGRIQH